MELRNEIEPQMAEAEKLYPEVLRLILAYTAFCDENGDEENIEYRKLEEKLHVMTGKDMSQFNLWEWWEADGAENLAFDICLPDPKIVENITKEELTEIIRKIRTFEEPSEEIGAFEELFYYRTDDYYQRFLELSFKTYQAQLFQRQKDKNGNYFEYTINDIVETLWNR